MKIYFGSEPVDDNNVTEGFVAPNQADYIFNGVVYTSADFSDVVIADTCGRLVPVNTDDVEALVIALGTMLEVLKMRNNAIESLAYAENECSSIISN